METFNIVMNIEDSSLFRQIGELADKLGKLHRQVRRDKIRRELYKVIGEVYRRPSLHSATVECIVEGLVPCPVDPKRQVGEPLVSALRACVEHAEQLGDRDAKTDQTMILLRTLGRQMKMELGALASDPILTAIRWGLFRIDLPQYALEEVEGLANAIRGGRNE